MMAEDIRKRVRKQGGAPCPADFEAVFVEIGRLVCEEHYGAGHKQVTAWLEQSGKDELIAKRKEYVREKRRREASVSRATMRRIRDSVRPEREARRPGYRIARQAAHHLRIVRNGGWIVSLAGGGKWWVGAKKVTAAEMIEMAKKVGFDPSTLSRSSE